MNTLDSLPSHKAQILCVDDEKNILSALRRTFRKTAHTIHLAESGAEGLKIIEEHPINLVISDMRMPNMDGAEFLKTVREKHPHIHSVLLTGYSDLDSTIKAVNEGKISGYLSKPWDDTELIIKVDSILKVYFLEQERKRLIAVTHKQNKKLLELNEKLEDKVKARTAELQQIVEMLEKALSEVEESHDSIVKVLSNVIQTRRGNSCFDYSKLAALAQRVAKEVTSDPVFIKQVYHAGLLFELGKLSMTDELFNQPIYLLSDELKKEYNQYPVLGEAALLSIPSLSDTGRTIRYHREYIDGSGEPEGLEGDDIPESSKLLSIVVDYFFLQWGVFQKKQLTATEARDYIFERKEKRYDEKLVNAFVKATKSAAIKKVKEKSVTSKQLANGMVLSRDCVSNKGQLLLSKGTTLDELLIEKLKKLEKFHSAPIRIYIAY
ncbi:HD domain-containing phosphohydrolase [Pleionea sediminis]|uniref:HD domain-containing phosphohydrolase n=1 Tax=Pleionea sediminis TaxID=2569479 RepID=UPI0011864631|nr:HD domain-containing phosphohydrolase [Pleionea sediminis]